MDDKFTILQFQERFPNDEAALEEIKQLKFGDTLDCPKCGKNNKFYKLEGRMAYSCAFCRHQIYPLKGTIFEKSTTPLRLWMYAMYLMAQTRAGISAKQLERELGVTYKTAFRMFHKIRELMADDDRDLTGEVEVDEVYMHPNPRFRTTAKKHNSEVVIGMVERKGMAKMRHVKSSGTRSIMPEVLKEVFPDATVYTDQHQVYTFLKKWGYEHYNVNHQRMEFVNGNIHTQNVENLFSNLKRGIRGVYRHVDAKYLQNYVNEYAFRYSNRDNPQMFDLILKRVI